MKIGDAHRALRAEVVIYASASRPGFGGRCEGKLKQLWNHRRARPSSRKRIAISTPPRSTRTGLRQQYLLAYERRTKPATAPSANRSAARGSKDKDMRIRHRKGYYAPKINAPLWHLRPCCTTKERRARIWPGDFPALRLFVSSWRQTSSRLLCLTSPSSPTLTTEERFLLWRPCRARRGGWRGICNQSSPIGTAWITQPTPCAIYRRVGAGARALSRYNYLLWEAANRVVRWRRSRLIGDSLLRDRADGTGHHRRLRFVQRTHGAPISRVVRRVDRRGFALLHIYSGARDERDPAFLYELGAVVDVAQFAARAERKLFDRCLFSRLEREPARVRAFLFTLIPLSAWI